MLLLRGKEKKGGSQGKVAVRPEGDTSGTNDEAARQSSRNTREENWAHR